MSFARKRLLNDMVKDAGLEVVSAEMRNGRVAIDARAPNGVTRTFSLSNHTRSDPKGDLNEHSRIKRFARENPDPAAAPAQQTEEEPSMAKKESTVIRTSDELTQGEFYKLCVWLTDVILAENPESLDALAAKAGAHFGRVISADTMREAMEATGTPAPECWTKLPDPHVIFARELEQLMTSLGQDASPLFRRYLSTLEVANG